MRIRGLRIGAEPSVVLEDCRDVVIEASDLRSVRLVDCTGVRVTGCVFRDASSAGVELDECDDVLIEGSRFERVASGVYAHRSRRVRVLGNVAVDVQGPIPRGQLVQFDKVSGPGNAVGYNVAINHRGTSRAEDAVNLFESRGTPTEPIRVHRNLLLGDPATGSDGFSDSGSGIMLGDGGGRFQAAEANVLINPGQVGVGVASGGEIAVVGNLVLGEPSDVANVGVYAWNQYEDSRFTAGAVTIRDNRIQWVNADGTVNHLWVGDGFPAVHDRDNEPGEPGLHRWRHRWEAVFDTLSDSTH